MVMTNDSKKQLIVVSKSSLKSLKRRIENVKQENSILFKLDSNLDRNESINFMDIFRDLHYKKHKLKVIAENSRFLRNLFEGYIPEIIGDNLVVKNY